MTELIVALPMYSWPERRREVDAEWAVIRDRLRAAGFDAPENLTRDTGDLYDFWRRPDLLFAQTCWGPMGDGLAELVQVIGQPSYDGIEGGQGELYSSAIVMRGDGLPENWRSFAPPSVLPDISPARGEISSVKRESRSAKVAIGESLYEGLISPLVGEMSGRTEGGNVGHEASIPLNLLHGKRLAYNVPDSMSGYIGLSRDLEALGESLAIFAEQVPTGGHRKSIRAVAEGRADVAAIDCMSWKLALEYEPAAKTLQVVGWTAKRPGLPFITAKTTPPDVVAALKAALSS